MKVDLGEKVQEGQLLSVVHDHQRTGIEPVTYHSQLDGILIAQYVPGLIGLGDTLAVVVTVTASPWVSSFKICYDESIDQMDVFHSNTSFPSSI